MRIAVASFVLLVSLSTALAGPLNPPAGPIASTYKTLAEIEPRIAVSATTTPGDATALYAITQPGSYYLTGNITGVSGKSGVRISADGVTLDLCGYSVTGVPGALVGVGEPGSATRLNICVRNGVVQSWPGGGVRFYKFASSRDHRYEDLTLVGNGVGNNGAGLECRDLTTVVNCVSFGNEGPGFALADGCVLIGCAARQNSIGFDIGFGCSFSECVSRANTSHGFVASNSYFIGCAATGNGGDGFQCFNQTAISQCAAHYNIGWGFNTTSNGQLVDSVASNNTSGGVLAGSGCDVRRCTVSTGAAGIRATGSGCRIEGNTVVGATTGFDITGSNHFIVANTCRGGTTRYSIVGVHTYGPIITAQGQIATTSPWANFEY